MNFHPKDVRRLPDGEAYAAAVAVAQGVGDQFAGQEECEVAEVSGQEAPIVAMCRRARLAARDVIGSVRLSSSSLMRRPCLLAMPGRRVGADKGTVPRTG
jgi:hypothetical protein